MSFELVTSEQNVNPSISREAGADHNGPCPGWSTAGNGRLQRRRRKMKQDSPRKARPYIMPVKKPEPPDRKFVLARLKKLAAELKAQTDTPRR
ncbi:hypothetical protein BH24PSE2_BH24PSE2_07410 [soil metagenome]